MSNAWGFSILLSWGLVWHYTVGYLGLFVTACHLSFQKIRANHIHPYYIPQWNLCDTLCCLCANLFTCQPSYLNWFIQIQYDLNQQRNERKNRGTFRKAFYQLQSVHAVTLWIKFTEEMLLILTLLKQKAKNNNDVDDDLWIIQIMKIWSTVRI